MVLDHVVGLPAPFADVEAAMERSTRWAERCRRAHRRNDQIQFAIVQGGLDQGLRRRSAEQLVALDFPGYAIGGLSVGEEPAAMYETIAATCPHLPEDRPRYLMGVGTPRDLLEGILRGIDMFDCVMPTRNGRNACGFTDSGQLKLRNACYRDDPRPLQADMTTPYSHLSRAYLRHLFVAGEMLGPILLSLHNVAYYQRLMRQAREAIAADSFLDFLQARTAGWAAEAAS
jgi:queuine tRNA-ribosyltransferase